METVLDRLQRASHPVPAAVNGTLGALFTRPADCPLRLGKTGYLPPVPQIRASPPGLPSQLSLPSSPSPSLVHLGRTEHRHHHHWRGRRSGADGPPPPLLGRTEKQLQEPAAHEVFFTPSAGSSTAPAPSAAGAPRLAPLDLISRWYGSTSIADASRYISCAIRAILVLVCLLLLVVK